MSNFPWLPASQVVSRKFLRSPSHGKDIKKPHAHPKLPNAFKIARNRKKHVAQQKNRHETVNWSFLSTFILVFHRSSPLPFVEEKGATHHLKWSLQHEHPRLKWRFSIEEKRGSPRNLVRSGRSFTETDGFGRTSYSRYQFHKDIISIAPISPVTPTICASPPKKLIWTTKIPLVDFGNSSSKSIIFIWLVVSTHLKTLVKLDNFPK